MSDWFIQTSLYLDIVKELRISNVISQCFLVNEVYIDNSIITIPPFVLSSLPFIIKDPSRIKNSKGRKYDLNTIKTMIDFTFFQPDCTIEYVLPNGIYGTKVLKACTSLKEMFNELFGDLEINKANILLSRSLNNEYNLLLPLCDLPIGLFSIPSAKWSIEFKAFPSEEHLSVHSLEMIRYWVALRIRNVGIQTSILKEIKEALNHFRYALAGKDITEKNQTDFNHFLFCLSHEKKYRKLANRSCSLPCGEFILTKDNYIEFSSDANSSFSTNTKDFYIKTSDNGKYIIIFSNQKPISLDKNNLRALSSLLNVYILDFYSSIQYQPFSISFPIMNNGGTIPRVLNNSRVNFIRPELLDKVIEKEKCRI